MKQTVTIEIANNSALQILRSLAALSLIKFSQEMPLEDDPITACYNEVYSKEDSSVDPFVAMAQAELISGDDW